MVGLWVHGSRVVSSLSIQGCGASVNDDNHVFEVRVGLGGLSGKF